MDTIVYNIFEKYLNKMIAKLEEELAILNIKKNSAQEDLHNVYRKKCDVRNVDIWRAINESEKCWTLYKEAEYNEYISENTLKTYKKKYLKSLQKLNKRHKQKNKLVRMEIKAETKYNKLTTQYINVKNKLFDHETNQEMKKYDLKDNEERKNEKMSPKLWKKIQQLPQDIIFIIRDYFMTINEQNRLLSYKMKKTILPKITKLINFKPKNTYALGNIYSKLRYFLFYISTDSAILSLLSKEEANDQISTNYNKTILPYSHYADHYLYYPRIMKNTIRKLLNILIKGKPDVANKIMKMFIIFAQEKYRISYDYNHLAYRTLSVEDLPPEYRI